ncbi:MAG: hypothetical protein PVF47_06435 [Anaerolineae bacterium]
MFEQKGKSVVDRLGVDQVVVVEDEDDRAGNGGQVVDQGDEDSFRRRRLGGLEDAQRPFPHLGLDRLQGHDQVGQEAGQVIVALVQGEPGRGALRTF